MSPFVLTGFDLHILQANKGFRQGISSFRRLQFRQIRYGSVAFCSGYIRIVTRKNVTPATHLLTPLKTSGCV